MGKGYIINVHAVWNEEGTERIVPPMLAPAVQKLVKRCEALGPTVLIKSHLYSYQGGMHNEILLPENRPANWDGTPHGGDVLICIDTEDRYGYVEEKNLEYYQVQTPEEIDALFIKE